MSIFRWAVFELTVRLTSLVLFKWVWGLAGAEVSTIPSEEIPS